MKRKYTLKRQLPDERDFTLSIANVKLPTSIDLRPLCPPVFDQGQLGSCSANAGVAAKMMLSKSNAMLSRLFLYYEERHIEGTINEDSGAQMRDIGKALQKYGVCNESSMPYVISSFTKAPTKSQLKAALKNKITSYHSVSGLNGVKTYLATFNQPVLIGMDVYDSFESDTVAKTGIVPMPDTTKEQLLGGHAVTAVGYDDSKNVLIVRNSWGAKWGDAGYFYLPYDYLNKGYAYDFWVLVA